MDPIVVPSLKRRFILAGWLAGILAVAGRAEDRKLTPEEKLVADQAEAYVRAHNEGDARALADFFAPDAEWVDAEGHVVSGREAIERAFRSGFARQKGRQLALRVESARPLTPEVILEKGTSVVRAPDGVVQVNSYTAVHAKRDGKWFISQVTETGAPLAGHARENLRPLEWLVGTWEEGSGGVKVRTTVQWARSGNFLTRTFKVAEEGEDEREGTEIIGWDAKAGQVRSWIFDSDGGFGEASWTRDGRRWLIQARATLPDGRQSSALHTLTLVSEDKCTWSSANREVDGELLPNIDAIEVVRVKDDKK